MIWVGNFDFFDCVVAQTVDWLQNVVVHITILNASQYIPLVMECVAKLQPQDRRVCWAQFFKVFLKHTLSLTFGSLSIRVSSTRPSFIFFIGSHIGQVKFINRIMLRKMCKNAASLMCRLTRLTNHIYSVSALSHRFSVDPE